jgi:TRAP-type C4-dicarboxylate transport system substrate-binding protein
MVKGKTMLLGIVLFVLLSTALLARPVTIKVASPAPKGSPWDRTLREISAEWSRISGGEIELKIYPGGIAGGEEDMIRKMRFNQLQGAVFTSLGLNEISKDTLALSTPFLITSNDEFDYVFEKIAPVLRDKFEEEGYKVISFSQAGWLHLFSKEKVVYPEDLRKLKVAGSDIEPAITQVWKNLGYNVIPISLNDLATGLSSGMIDACYLVVVAATAYQLYNVIDYMMDYPISPVLGGFVITERAWRRVDDEYKPELLEVGQKAADSLYKKMQELEAESRTMLEKQGVEIVDLPPAAEEAWKQEIVDEFEAIAGSAFSQEFFDLIKKHVQEFRK